MMCKQPMELSLIIKIELVNKMLLHCVITNNNTHTQWDSQCSKKTACSSPMEHKIHDGYS